MTRGDGARAIGIVESDPGPVGDEPQHLRELRHMQEVARLLVSNLDPQAALDELAAAAARIASPGRSASGRALVLCADEGRADGELPVVLAPAGEAASPFARALRGHVRYVLESGRSVHFAVEEVPAGAARRELAEAGICSVALVPIQVADETFGVLAAGGPDGRLIAPHRLRRLALLADLGGLAIANATAYQRERHALTTSQERLRELTLLHEATRKFSATLSVEQIEREAVRTAVQLVTAGRGAGATFVRADGEAASVPGPAGPSLRTALAEGRAVAAAIPGPPLRHVAFAPVFVRDQPYGAVVVTGADGRELSSDQLRRLEAIASLAGLAIGNCRHFEAVRREGERVAALEETKTKFLRLASHELRGPLAVLRGYVSMLRDGTFSEQPDQVKDVYAILEAKAGQIELLVTQMLEAARLEEGRLRLDLRRIDLRDPVREAFEGAGLVAQADHELSLKTPAWPVEVVADAGRVTTIVANLLDNAIKYSPQGGPVRCVVRLEPGRAVVEVSDRGLGIAAADQRLLFTSFGRVETPANRHIQGTGLGLYLSRELAQMQSGTLTANSEVGRGSTFSLTLLLAPTA
jgi:signal transduction histidine kinase